MKNTANPLFRATVLSLVVLLPNASHALVSGDGTADDAYFPELILAIFDPVKKVSFTLDLGLYVAPTTAWEPGAPVLDPAKNFFVQAQQDGGYQKFFAPLNNDINFKEFLKKSTDSSNQVWGVYAGSQPGFSVSSSFYTTLTSATATGTLNPEYTLLTQLRNDDLADASKNWANYAVELNTGGESNPFNSHGNSSTEHVQANYDLNGSSFDGEGTAAYFTSVFSPTGGIGNRFTSTVNPIGSSSWFYYLKPSSLVSSGVTLIDEFDNLKHDAYWGLAKADNGDYILSFTMEGVNTSVATALGLQRRNLTDFSALYGNARLVLTPGQEFAGWAPSGDASVSAVPEPATYGLFGFGLAALAWRRRRAQQS